MLGLWQRRAAAAPRPEAGESRETGSPQGTRGRGLPQRGGGRIGETPSPVWSKRKGGDSRCVCQGRLRALPAPRPGTAAASCPPQRCPAARWGWLGILVPRQPVPRRRLESRPRCPLPACARETWLGMNVAKRGGSAPARSRRGERHTRPCALSRGGPGRRRGDEGGCRAGVCPASWARRGDAVAVVFSTAVPARQGWTARPGTTRGGGSGGSPSCHPTAPHASTGQGDAESVAADGPKRGPVRAGGLSRNK